MAREPGGKARTKCQGMEYQKSHHRPSSLTLTDAGSEEEPDILIHCGQRPSTILKRTKLTVPGLQMELQ